MVILLLGPGAFFSVILFWLYVSPVTAAIVNRTIDDSFGDSQTGQLVTYAPATAGVWADETCAVTVCAIRPDTTQAFKGTYTAATYNPGLGSMSITMQFTGTAIYVFFILANAHSGITTLTLANMTLDGNAPELFQHFPDLTTTDLDYNSLVFSKANLANVQHTLVISTSGNTNVFVNFDYAIYTHEDNTPLLPSSPSGSASLSATLAASPSATLAASPSASLAASPSASLTASPSASLTASPSASLAATLSASQTASEATKTPTDSTTKTAQDNSSSNKSPVSAGAIAGGVIGGTAALALLGILLFCLRRRNHRSRNMIEVRDYVPPYQDTSAGNSPSSSSGVNYMDGGRPPPLRSVTSGDHLLGMERVSPVTPERPLSNVEAIRQARQNEIDQRLRAVQQEMMSLASDLGGGERGSRLQPLRRQGAMNQYQAVGGEEYAAMSIAEMEEQLRITREQIASLQEQQQSAWAQGLSDDPPPGYTPAT